MPASIQDAGEVKLFNAAPFSSPSPSSSTISCESIKTIEAWLNEVEEPEVTVIVKELGKAGSDLAQEPEVGSSRKRKHSSSLTEADLSQSSLRKRSKHLLQLVTDYGMAGNTLGGGQLPPTPQGSSADPPSTPSTIKTRSKAPVDPGWTSSTLAMHGLKCDDNKALARYPEFEKKIMGIVNSERHSEMKPESAKLVQQAGEILEHDNEATFLGTLLPLIIKPKRIVDLASHEPAENLPEMSAKGSTFEVVNPQPDVVYGCRTWIDDGVHAVFDRDFRTGLLPHHYIDEQLAHEMRKDDNMLTPRPDRCYGLLKEWITVPDGLVLDPDIRALITACPALSHSFFLIEGKSNRGDKLEAMLQARRGGASLVNAMRLLLAKIGEPHVTESGVDDRNFVFSATMIPGLIDIWVHWAELVNGTPVFHMNMIDSFASKSKRQFPEIRKILHNILSWGWDLKARRLNELHEKIYTWQRKENAKLKEENRQKEVQKELERKEKAESRKRQRNE